MAQPARRTLERQPASACSVREVSRGPLIVEGGRELYVEPTAFAESRGRLLLAGTPNYLWRRRPGSRVHLEAQDSVFGAIIESDGQARLVRAPVDPRLVHGVRALAREDGKWDVIFAEIERPRANPGDEGVAVRLWYGIFDGRSWSAMEQIPMPANVRVRLFDPSPIIRRGDTLAWTAPVNTPTGMTEAVVYERRDGRWSFDFLPTYYSTAYSLLASSDTLGLIAVAVHPDSALTTDENSLFVYTRRPSWQRFRRIILGRDEPVFGPSIVLGARYGTLSWWTPIRTEPSRMEARTMIGRVETGVARQFALDSSISRLQPVLSPYLSMRLWVTEHIDPINPMRRLLRFIGDTEQSAVLLGEIPSPFLGPFAAEARAPSEIILAGPLPGASVADPEVVTLLIRARVHCAAEARRRG